MQLKVLVLFTVVVFLVPSHSGHQLSRANYRNGGQYQYPWGARQGIYSGLYDGFARYFNSPTLPPRPCERQLNRRDCPLYDFGSNLVTKDDFFDKVVAEENAWVGHLILGINNPVNYGRCDIKWNLADEDGTSVRPAFCINLDNGTCKNFTLIKRYQEDDCGRITIEQYMNLSVELNVKFSLQSRDVDDEDTDKLYSQDLDQYFWWALCVDRWSETECDHRFILLMIKRNRYNPDGVADLTGLPWDKIAADLRFVFGRDISDPEFKQVQSTKCTHLV